MSSNIVCSLIPRLSLLALSLLLRREPRNEATLSPVNPISNGHHRKSIWEGGAYLRQMSSLSGTFCTESVELGLQVVAMIRIMVATCNSGHHRQVQMCNVLECVVKCF